MSRDQLVKLEPHQRCVLFFKEGQANDPITPEHQDKKTTDTMRGITLRMFLI